jgi:hypothetical protein
MNSSPFKGAWKMITIMGIPIRVHFSWLIVYRLTFIVVKKRASLPCRRGNKLFLRRDR